MPINAVCPECRATYVLGDQQKGKKVRCKKCQAVFVAGAARPQMVDEPLDVEVVAEPPRPRPRSAPSSVTTGRTAPPPRAARDEDDDRRPRRRDRDDRDEDDDRPRGSSALPWAITGVVVGLLVLIGGVVAVVVVMRDDGSKTAAKNTFVNPTPVLVPPAFNPQPANPNPPITPQPITPQPIEAPPVRPADPPPARPVDPVKPPADPPAADPAPASGNGQITPQLIAKVKRATVYLKVTMADGSVASGTGFFGAEEARNLILTNAHVVGMLSPDNRRPRSVEVYINSGQTDERKTTALVLGVDRVSDLAVLDVGTSDGMPEPLTVKSAAGLVELTRLYTFGFPLGEHLGKEITVRDTSVSSLRKKHGALDRIQVNGGMDPGNSGGPVVDGNGHVVGVAVSGIPGKQINFAIPGDRVHAILNGRISSLASGMPYYTDNRRVAFPLSVEMIDPRNRIKAVSLDVWTGNVPPPNRPYRPAADAQPGTEAGDSQHMRYTVPYEHGIARGEVILPELPPGKVWWIQPNWVNAAGQSHWASANVWKPPSEPVERKPASLVSRLLAGNRTLTLTGNNLFKLSGNDDDEDAPYILRTRIVFNEQAVPTGNGGGTLRLRYRQASSEEIEDKQSHPSDEYEAVKNDLPQVVAVLQMDALGNLTQNALDPQLRVGLQRLGPAGRQRMQQISEFHAPIQGALESLSVPLPGREVKPLETWTARRALPIDRGRRRYQSGQIDLVFTYLGQRKRNGRDEAVLSIEGAVRGGLGPSGKELQLGGKATGTVLVDLATGQVTMTETRVSMEMDIPLGKPGDKDADKSIRLLAVHTTRLERGL